MSSSLLVATRSRGRSLIVAFAACLVVASAVVAPSMGMLPIDSASAAGYPAIDLHVKAKVYSVQLLDGFNGQLYRCVNVTPWTFQGDVWRVGGNNWVTVYGYNGNNCHSQNLRWKTDQWVPFKLDSHFDIWIGDNK